MKDISSPHVSRLLQQCNDVESNPGPLRPGTNKSTSSSSSNGSTSYASLRRVKQQQKQQQQQQQQHKAASMLDLSHGEELELGIGPTRVDRLEREMQGLQQLLGSLDSSVTELRSSVEGMRPAYNQALQMLSSSSLAPPGQKNNLVFHGIAPDSLEVQMETEPEFCRDVLETRIKMIFREHLRIARDIPFTQIYRVDAPAHSNSAAPRPLVVGFKSLKDRDNILNHTNLLRREGIYITEDTTGKVPPWMKKQTLPPSPFKKKKTGSESSNNSASGAKATTAAAATTTVPATAANIPRVKKNEASSILETSDHLSSCNSDYAPSSHSGNSSSGAFTDD